MQEATGKPCAIDSPNPSAIEAALSVHKGTPIINSISLERNRYEKLMPLIAGTDLKVIALCMSDEGMPARKLLNQTFMVMAIAKGLDGAIINPLDHEMMSSIIAAEALAGRDRFCGNYLKAFRAGLFG